MGSSGSPVMRREGAELSSNELDRLCINTIRTLSIQLTAVRSAVNQTADAIGPAAPIGYLRDRTLAEVNSP